MDPVNASPAITPVSAPVQAAPVVPPAAAPATDSPAAAPPAAAGGKPGILERVEASVRSKATLLTENKTYLSRAEAAETALAAVTAERNTAHAELAELREEHTKIETALERAEEENTTVAQAAVDQVAALGVATEELPAADPEGSSTLETLESKMAAATEPLEKGRLAKQIRTLEDAN